MNTNRQTLHYYWQQTRKHRTSFLIALLCVPLASLLLDTILPLYLSKSIGALQQNNVEQVKQFLLIAGGISIVGILTNIIGFQSLIIHESRVRAKLVNSTLSKLIYKDQAFFARQKIGALTGKFIDFINAHVGLQDLLIMRTLTFIVNIVIGVGIIFTNSPLVALLVIGLIIILFVQIKISLKLRAPLRKERKRLIGEQNGAIADTISNSLTVKTFAHEQHELNETRTIAEKYQYAYNRDFRWMAIEGSLRLLLMSIIQIAAVGIMAYLYMNDRINLEIAVFVVLYLQRIAAQLFSLGEIINGYDRYFLQAAPMTEVLQEEDRIRDTPKAKELHVSDGEIRFDSVSYSYEDDRNAAVINDLSLTIAAGQKVGLIGRSGAGKTTLTKTLLRFDDISSGEIVIDGQNIQTVTQESLRQAISYVPQEPLLFHRSLRENIAYGNLAATDEQILEATKQAHAWEFVQKLPNGFDTIVGERGVKLSGGQRQRIAIARAILKDAPILILDEATAALDSESEKLIQDALETLMIGRTSIVIAHRLSTIAKLDRIVVLDSGKIIEDGTHRALLTKHGVYAKLWSHQSGGFIEE